MQDAHTANFSNEVIIHTTAPTITIGQLQISADRRAAKGTELTDAERIRRIVLPANHWGSLAATSNLQTVQGLTDILTNGLKAIAADKLRDTLAENPMQRTVSLADYTVAALLAWSNETASTRGSLTFTREQVEQWFPTSSIYIAMSGKGKQWVEFVGARLATLAAKNHGLKKPEDADKLITLLAADADRNDGLAMEIIQRLSHISKNLAAKTASTSLSMDDL